ncbi:TasA family protein [Cellulomonas edaphi]|uniref:TasA family protein n=1 Tax=Cellulomonas edaphi TaxID=3053468 RepID=A0ABT7S9K8_9CELL|nr:TasA family protein [Cellulomons edaphi]MDM7832313.1 TasA family protein [Cellulomons edaphi]
MDDLLQEMINPAPAQHDRPRRRRLWTTVVVVGLAAVGISTLTTSALFSDQEKSGATITTGSLDLDAASSLDFTMPVDNMVPGAQIVAPITLDNVGSLAFEYSVSVDATQVATDPADDPDLGTGETTGGDLRTQLRLDLYKVANPGACTLAAVSTATPLGSSGTGWGITSKRIRGGSVAGAPGNLELDAATDDVLCARVSFDEAATNEYQNTAAKVTLTFDAMQLPFNPGQLDTSKQ